MGESSAFINVSLYTDRWMGGASGNLFLFLDKCKIVFVFMNILST